MSTKYNGMKKARDWDGQRVRLTREVRNGMGIVPKGTAGRLGDFTRNGNIDFQADECKCCGAVFRVSGLHYEDFELAIDLQPMLEEMKQALGNPTMRHPELVKLYKTHGHDAVNAALVKHWDAVSQDLTTEYIQL